MAYLNPRSTCRRFPVCHGPLHLFRATTHEGREMSVAWGNLCFCQPRPAMVWLRPRGLYVKRPSSIESLSRLPPSPSPRSQHEPSAPSIFATFLCNDATMLCRARSSTRHILLRQTLAASSCAERRAAGVSKNVACRMRICTSTFNLNSLMILFERVQTRNTGFDDSLCVAYRWVRRFKCARRA